MTQSRAGHLTAEALDDFFLGAATRFELGRNALRHLAETCPRCRRRAAAIGDLDAAFAAMERRGRAAFEEIEGERAALPDRLAELSRLGSFDVLDHVRRDRRFHTPAVAEHELAVGWLALEAGDREVAEEAQGVAHVALDGADPARYGRTALAELRAESWLLVSRLATTRRDATVARRGLEEAERSFVRSGRPADLDVLTLIARSEIEMLAGRFASARRLATEAAGAEARGLERWSVAVERLRAELDRLDGGSRELLERSRAGMYAFRPHSAIEWSLALELVRALVDEGEADEALLVCALWRTAGDEARSAPRPTGQIESELLRGAALGATGRRLEGRRILESARSAACASGYGWAAVEATVELCRLAEAAGDPEPLREAAWDLSALGRCPNLPHGALRTLARFATALWRDRPDRVLALERRLRMDTMERDDRVETT